MVRTLWKVADMHPRTTEIAVKLAFLAAACWLILTALSVQPDGRGYGTHESLGMEPCGYLERTGQPCATCGMTTAFSNTVRLRLPSAFRANPAGMLLCLLVISMPAWILHSIFTGAPCLRFLLWRGGRLIPVILLLLVMASWLWKMSVFKAPQ